MIAVKQLFSGTGRVSYARVGGACRSDGIVLRIVGDVLPPHAVAVRPMLEDVYLFYEVCSEDAVRMGDFIRYLCWIAGRVFCCKLQAIVKKETKCRDKALDRAAEKT